MQDVEREPRSRSFPCEGCGGDLELALGARELACPYCGLTRAIGLGPEAEVGERELLPVLERQAARRSEEAEAPGALELRCGSCAAAVVFQDRLVTTRCAYCAAPIQQEDAHAAEGRIPVDAVVPFAVERDTARAHTRDWLRSRWFAPRAFGTRNVPEALTGVYLPFWTFDAASFTHYRGQRGTLPRRARKSSAQPAGADPREAEVRWEPAAGAFQRLFDDVAVAADRSLPERTLRRLEPWDFQRALPFRPALLAGHLSKTYEVPLEEAWKAGRQRMEEALEHQVRSEIGGDHQRIERLAVRWDALSYKHVLLPVWLVTVPFRGQPYRILVNGATGEVQGDRPWSWRKLALAALGAAAAAAALLFALR